MTFECCDTVCATPFCPSCGNAMPKLDIDGLLKHVRSTISKLVKLLKQARHDHDNPEEGWDVAHVEEIVHRKDRTLAKWRSWETSLVKVIREASEVAP